MMKKPIDYLIVSWFHKHRKIFFRKLSQFWNWRRDCCILVLFGCVVLKVRE